MIGEIKATGLDAFLSFCLSLRHEGVPGIGRLVVFLFRRCITFCKECKLRANAKKFSFRISLRWPINIINSVDKTKLSCNIPPPTQHHSFFRNGIRSQASPLIRMLRLIRDRIVVGIRDNGTRKRLLQKEKITLNKCIDICRSSEATSG